MSIQSVNLPINIPWKLVAASPDMMDTTPHDFRFPFPWRSSLAIYAYEPKPEDLDPALCDHRITFFKVTASITGLQLSEDETKLLYTKYGTRIVDYLLEESPEKDPLKNILEAYYACYGVLLNVAVYPHPSKNVTLADFPHIIDFEPKKRDLYQAATENGEVVTASRTEVGTNKSLTTMNDSQTGLSLGAEFPLGKTGGTGKAGLTQSWGRTQTDAQVTNVDSSRDSRESSGTSTNITQMYNLMTGYHAGTNRATFLMQPRPHNRQTTDRRTFVQGLREIEGMQDFFLVVSRPAKVQGLCIDVVLDTGHYGEGTQLVRIEGAYEKDHVDQRVRDEVTAFYLHNVGYGDQPPHQMVKEYDVLQSGWEFDPDPNGDGSIGTVEQLSISRGDSRNKRVTVWVSNPLALGVPTPVVEKYDVKNIEAQIVEGKLRVMAQLCVDGPYYSAEPPRSPEDVADGNTCKFDRTYRVHIRRLKGSAQAEIADNASMIIAERSLSTCLIADKNGCISAETPDFTIPDLPMMSADPGFTIVDEATIRWTDLLKDSVFDNRAIYQRLQGRLAGSWRMPSRRSVGITSLLDTDLVKNEITRILPKEVLAQPVSTVGGINPKVLETMGEKTYISNILSMDLTSFALKTNLTIEEAANVRRLILGLPKTDLKPTPAKKGKHQIK